jgi:integrase/recombinase XerD
MKAYLEPEEINLMEEACNNLRDRLLMRLLFHSACRISEALGITLEDVDITTGTVTIQHLKTRLQLSCPDCNTQLGRNHSFCPKCGIKVEKAVSLAKEHRRMRTLPLDEQTTEMLKEYISRGGPVEKDRKKVIFGINRHRAWQIIRNCADKAGLPKLMNPETGKVHGVSPHKLRDAFAVHAMKLDDSGDGMRLLQEHLGHASFNTTAKYRKVSGQDHQDWYRKLWEKNGG